jgi:hypothetical protein
MSVPGDQAKHDQIVDLVTNLIVAKESMDRDGDDEGRNHNARTALTLEREINALIYELYDLAKNEIELIERAREE